MINRRREGKRRRRERGDKESEKEKKSDKQTDGMRERSYFTRTFSLLKMKCLDRLVYKRHLRAQGGRSPQKLP